MSPGEGRTRHPGFTRSHSSPTATTSPAMSLTQDVRHGELASREFQRARKGRDDSSAQARTRSRIWLALILGSGNVFVDQRVGPAVLVNAGRLSSVRYYNGHVDYSRRFPVTSEVRRRFAIVKFCVLASGSSGNAALTGDRKHADSDRRRARACATSRSAWPRLASDRWSRSTRSSSPTSTRDHVCGAGCAGAAARACARLSTTRLTAPASIRKAPGSDRPPRIELFQAGASFTIGDIEVQSFSIPTTPPIRWAICLQRQGVSIGDGDRSGLHSGIDQVPSARTATCCCSKSITIWTC